MSHHDKLINYTVKNKLLLGLSIVTAITFIVYIPLFQNGFLKTWDDNRYVIENEYIKHLDVESILTILTIYYDGHYHPITLLSLALDFKIGGLEPKVFHITNLILHLINTILVFGFAHLLLKKKTLFIPFFVSLFFGIATINVESVAWISERKNLLYTLFFLTSLIAYLKYIELKKTSYFILSLLFFLLSILSKSMAISLSVSLILIDLYFKREIFSRKIIIEKIPFFLLAIFFGIIAIFAQKTSWGEDLSQINYSFFQRLLFAGNAFVMYFLKTIIPFRLSGFYPYPELYLITLIFSVIGISFSAAIFAIAVYLFKKYPVFSFGLLFFCINIFLLLKLFEVPAGDYFMADRYAYIPSIGIFLMLGSGVSYFFNQNQMIKRFGITILIVYVLFILLQTFNRIAVWKNDVAFYSDIISKFPAAEVAYTNRGAIRKENRDLNGALSDFNETIKLGKKDYKSFSNRGAVYLDMGEYKLALDDYSQALKQKPDHPQILADYGYAQMRTGNLNLAMESFTKSLKVKPFNPEVHVNKGTVLHNMGKFDEAVSEYNMAIDQKSDYKNAYFNRGLTNIMMNRLDEAITDFGITINLDPKHAEAWSNMGIAWSRSGDVKKAYDCYENAIKLRPSYFEAWLNRGIDKYYNNDLNSALADLNQAIQLNPSLGPAYYFRALVTIKTNEKSACEDLKKALDCGFQQAAITIKMFCD